MLPLFTAGQGRLVEEGVEIGDKMLIKGANITGNLVHGVPQAEMDRLVARLKGLNVGGKSVIEQIEMFGSRSTGWSMKRNAPVNSGSDLDILLTISREFNEGRNRDWITKIIDNIGSDFKSSTGIKASLHNPKDGVRVFKDSVWELDITAKFINLFKR